MRSKPNNSIKIRLEQNPSRILFGTESSYTLASSCDHYAGSPTLIEKSLKLQTSLNGRFDLTCDLEDGASIGDETKLRATVSDIINSQLNKFAKVGIRVHDASSKEFKSDIEHILRACGNVLSHITVPKVLSLKQARMITKFISACARRLRIKRNIPLHFLVETHGALRDVDQIAAIPEVRGLDFGLMDFVSEHLGAIPSSCMSSPGQFEHALVVRAKSIICAAACAHGKVASHNVTTAYNDVAQTFQDASIARTRFGFSRMWSIHPSQIKPILDAMQPDMTEVLSSIEIILAAQKAAWAPISHQGRLHDRASYRYHWHILRRAALDGAKLPQELEVFIHPTA